MQLNYSSQNAVALRAQGLKKWPGGWQRVLPSVLPAPQVWSSHSARFGALHVCTSTVSSHSLQRTAQHQWNLHSHLVMRVTRVVSYPRPQHITSQPSVPRDILLHTRPAVPREPAGGRRARQGVPSPSCSSASSTPCPTVLGPGEMGIYHLRQRPRTRVPSQR